MKRQLKIKVCGMKYYQNLLLADKLPIDFLGFIFYEKSKRFINASNTSYAIKTTKNKVAVFVNEKTEKICSLAKKSNFKYIQLHGNENIDDLKKLKNYGFNIIKAFNIHENFNFSLLNIYQPFVDFFLFDNKTSAYGGSGKKFNWSILSHYKGKTPFFLSGGIQPNDSAIIKSIEHPMLYGIDINSGFEDAPGLKNINQLDLFINELSK